MKFWCLLALLIALPVSAQNLALNKPTTVTSIDGPYGAGINATDGKPEPQTRWAADRAQATAVLQVDLGQRYSIGQVKIFWEVACGKSYTIDVSDDAVTWVSLYGVTGNAALINDITVTGSGRYIRMNGREKCTGYGYSIWEFEVYAPGTGPLPPPITPTPGLGSVTLTCTYPTLNEDGTALPLADITGINMYYGMNGTNLDKKFTVDGNTSCVHQFTGLAAGLWFFQATTLTATDESARTNLASALVVSDTPPPPPPVLSVVDPKVYKQTLAVNGWTMVEVGVIALKTACVVDHVVDGFNLLPDRRAVTYTCGPQHLPCPPSKIVLPLNAFARCALQ